MEPDSAKLEPSEILGEFSELITTCFQPLNQRMEYAKELQESITFSIVDFCYDPEFEIQRATGSKQVLERRLIELLLEFFTIRAQDLELVTKTDVDLNALKMRIVRVKNHIYALHQRLDVLERMFDKARLLYSNESFNTEIATDHGNGSNGLAIKLSKKLAVIRIYLIQESVSTSSFEDSSIQSPGFSGTNGESEDGQEGEFKREYQKEEDYSGVKTFEELKKKIGDLTAEKRAKIETARKDGKKSFMEWLKECDEPSQAEYSNSVHMIKDLGNEVGILLSLVLSEFLLVASESENKVKQYRKYFKAIVGYFLVGEEKNWMAIEKIVSVLDLAEKELVEIGQLSPEVLNDEESNDHDDDDEAEIFDKRLDYFFAIVLCLEYTVWSRPISRPESGNINLNADLMDVEETLRHGKDNLEDTLSIVQSWRTVQYDPWTEEGYNVLRAEFQEVMKLKVAEIWGGNGQIDEAN